MFALHQCEASTWRHYAHLAKVVRGCAAAAVADSGRLPVLVFILAAVAAAAVVDPQVEGLCMRADRMADCTKKLQATVSTPVES